MKQPVRSRLKYYIFESNLLQNLMISLDFGDLYKGLIESYKKAIHDREKCDKEQKSKESGSDLQKQLKQQAQILNTLIAMVVSFTKEKKAKELTQLKESQNLELLNQNLNPSKRIKTNSSSVQTSPSSITTNNSSLIASP